MKQLLIFLCLASTLFAKPTVCLNMIVKNERPVIERCLASVKPYIDSWVIVDTGSTDGTQEAIRNYLSDIPGELYERPWVNFAHNRNEAMQLAGKRGDYLLFIDADETLEVQADFTPQKLDTEMFLIHNREKVHAFLRVFMVRSDLKAEWEGSMHERLEAGDKVTQDLIETAHLNSSYADGARSRDPQKYAKDALLLEEELKKDPNNLRTWFYLGQCYTHADQREKALKCFIKATNPAYHLDDRFSALISVAYLMQVLNYPDDQVIEAYHKAHLHDNGRLEPIFEIGHIFFENGQFNQLKQLVELGMKVLEQHRIIKPVLYSQDETILNYKMELLYIEYMKSQNRGQEVIPLLEEMITRPTMPEGVKIIAQNNLDMLKNETPTLHEGF